MAEAVISVLLDQLASVTHESVGKKTQLIMRVNKELENLRGNLVAIKAVLTDAEMRQLKEEAVKLWVEDLKDVSYDMDSVLDKWNTAILKSEFDQGENGAESPKVRSSMLFFSCFHCTKLSPYVIIHRLKIAKEIQSLNRKIERITLRKDRFGFRETSGDSVGLKRPDYTTSFLDVPVIYGQLNYKQILIDRLRLSGSNQDDNEPKFISIVGMGGIGKTTLARNVYNDGEIKTLFEGNMIWVCVSDPFDTARIAKEIIEQVTRQTPAVIGLELLIDKFRESIKGKKFLLVLDDVWTTDYSKWLSLEQILRLGALGSRVVVTTRNEEVARMIGDENRICVNKLTEEDCWLLLREIALSNKTEQVREDFDAIGRKIARKCNGLPLAAKAIGSLLRVKDIEYWQEMSTSEIWELKNMEVELFNPLLFSYYDLTPVERRCFLYCAVFPKDNVFERDELIQQWAAQGYLKSRNNDQDGFEQMGLVCFQNLAMRSFFQEFNYDDYNFTIKFKMHDIVHDFARYLTKNECSIQIISEVEKRVELNVRHLNLIHISLAIPTFSNLKKKNLHTLTVWCALGCMVPHQHLRCLRTLILVGELMKLPTNIGDLIHLRYLSIDSGVETILNVPPTIGNLFNLQTLKFLSRIKELPEEVGKLINLRHLRLSEGLTESRLKSIGNLTSLQTLDNRDQSFWAYNKQRMIIDVRDFQKLNSLRKIWLEILGKEEHKEEAKEAQLHNKTALVHLELKFAFNSDMETHEIVLETLRPHENLKYLRIEGYLGGSISPSWMMSLINMRSLYLYECVNYTILPPLGRLPCLESLHIHWSGGLEKMGPEFLGVEMDNNTSAESLFPKLKQLQIKYADLLKEWVGVAGWKINGPLKIMPSLENLVLIGCLMLEALPDFLESTPLKNLEIRRCYILENSCKRETGEDWPKIRHVPNIVIER
ncbi:putative disease resistance protein RGA3 [Humulus lupulus]|uniref:putative disease resistance protein RGA3 n=1 Tax=Humulus lupulus TaxID=3486 RepID=UPI002B40C7B8|nr:putative disease resistance protein RGA3 [Humulus lupulus]